MGCAASTIHPKIKIPPALQVDDTNSIKIITHPITIKKSILKKSSFIQQNHNTSQPSSTLSSPTTKPLPAKLQNFYVEDEYLDDDEEEQEVKKNKNKIKKQIIFFVQINKIYVYIVFIYKIYYIFSSPN
jgi:hypothetical protein